MPSAFSESWYSGKGLKQGDYFRFSVCSTEYHNCAPLEIDFWVQNQSSTSHDYFLQMLVIDGNKTQKGTVMTAPSLDPVYSDPNISDYSNIYKNTILWLGGLAPPESPKDFGYPTWSRLGACCGNLGIRPLGQEQVTVQAGSYKTWVVGQLNDSYSNNDLNVKFWVVPTMPFPIKGIWSEVRPGTSEFNFRFELLATGNSKTEPIWTKTETASLENSKNIAINSTNNNMQYNVTSSKLIPHSYERSFSPLKQFKSGIALKDIKCASNLQIVIKTKNHSPACVKAEDISKLVERGWAISIVSESHQNITQSISCKEPNPKTIYELSTYYKVKQIVLAYTPIQKIIDDSNYCEILALSDLYYGNGTAHYTLAIDLNNTKELSAEVSLQTNSVISYRLDHLAYSHPAY